MVARGGPRRGARERTARHRSPDPQEREIRSPAPAIGRFAAESRIEPIELERSRHPDCAAARPPARNHSAPVTRRPSAEVAQVAAGARRRPNRRGRARPGAPRTAVRREQQAEPVQQREQTPFHSRGIYSRGRWLSGRGLHSTDGQGTRASVRLRASARAAAPANRLDRPGCGRGACCVTRPPVDQARGEAVRARPGRPHDGPDHARGPGHAREDRRADLEGDPTRPLGRERSVRRSGVRLPESGPCCGRAGARARASRWRRSRLRFPRARARRASR